MKLSALFPHGEERTPARVPNDAEPASRCHTQFFSKVYIFSDGGGTSKQEQTDPTPVLALEASVELNTCLNQFLRDGT